ncbi:HAMP domain-containing protein [bacterium]|nr:HAMP domain-containing protein [bacterium]
MKSSAGLQLRGKLWILVIVCWASIVVVGAMLSLQISQTTQVYQSILAEEVEQQELARQMQVTFKKQVQEWKNVLIRGHNQESLEKYRGQFLEAEASALEIGAALQAQATNQEVLAKLGEFMEAMDTMGQGYRAAMAEFENSAELDAEGFADRDYKAADKMVKGQDRAPTDLIDEIVEIIATDRTTRVEKQHQDLKREQLVLLIVLSVIAVIMIVMTILSLGTAGNMVTSLKHLAGAMQAMAGGDFSVQVKPAKSRDEIGQLTAAVIEMQAGVSELVEQVNSAAMVVASSSEELSASADETARAVQDVAATVKGLTVDNGQTKYSLEEAQGKLSEAARAIEKVADDIKDMAGYAHDAAEQGLTGRQSADEAAEIINGAAHSVRETTAVVQLLGEKTNQIAEFIDIITGIADQTNLLALNAAIEAARAGEAGRGFAVVAEEVRKLAEESNSAAGNITTLVKAIETEMNTALEAMSRSDQEVGAGAETVSKASEVLSQIVANIQALSDKVNNVSEVARGISATTEDVVAVMRTASASAESTFTATERVSESTESQTANMEEIGASANSLARLSQELQAEISRFTTSGAAAAEPEEAVAK